MSSFATGRYCAGVLLVLGALGGSSSCTRPVDKTSEGVGAAPASTAAPAPAPGLHQPLTAFTQKITSSAKTVSLRPKETAEIPVRIENPGSDTWMTAGPLPITISYKFFSGNEMLPIEGERTFLPKPIGPASASDVNVRVVAPPKPGKYELRVTLVQEGVAWFMTKSNTFLSLPVTVR